MSINKLHKCFVFIIHVVNIGFFSILNPKYIDTGYKAWQLVQTVGTFFCNHQMQACYIVLNDLRKKWRE